VAEQLVAVPKSNAPGSDFAKDLVFAANKGNARPMPEPATGLDFLFEYVFFWQIALGQSAHLDFEREASGSRPFAFPLDVESHARAQFGMFAQINLVGIALEQIRRDGVPAFVIEEMRKDFDDAARRSEDGWYRGKAAQQS